MSTTTITKKRKSADGAVSATKKVKVAKSADKPAPVKSALKRAAEEEHVEVKTKKKSKPVIEAHEVKKVKPTTKAAKPAKKAEKKDKIVLEDNSDEDEPAGNTLTPDQTASLLAGFSSDSDNDDAANGDDQAADIPLAKLPKAPTTAAIQSRIASATKTDKTTSDPEKTPGVIYIGRIPHGFHEPQMRAYFSQFGTLTHLKLARNRKTGASKHFGFIEFASSAVADIVAKTMDKYLMFGHILQVRRVPAEQGEGKEEAFWKGEGRRGRKVVPRNKLEGGHLRRGRERGEWNKRVEREGRRRERKAEKLKEEMEYEFEMPKVKGTEAVPVRMKAVEAGEGESGPAVSAGADAVEAEETVMKEGEGAGEETVVVEKKTRKRAAEGKPKVKEAKKVVKKVKA